MGKYEDLFKQYLGGKTSEPVSIQVPENTSYVKEPSSFPDPSIVNTPEESTSLDALHGKFEQGFSSSLPSAISDPGTPKKTHPFAVAPNLTATEIMKQRADRDEFDRRIPEDQIVQSLEFSPHMDIKGTSYIAEQFRNLRTHFIQFSQNTSCKFILLTSCHHGEGKTTTAINLARYLSKNKEKRTLLVDCDMRRPKIKDYIMTIGGMFDKMRARDKKPVGISDLLMEKDGNLSLNSAILFAKQENLWILPSVKATGQAAELMETKKFDALLREVEYLFDYIILDTSPILSTTDPAILGAKVGYVSLVIRCEHTQRETVQGATNLLEQIGINVLGVILTHMRQIIPKYFYRYQYYQGYYYDAYYADVPEQASGAE